MTRLLLLACSALVLTGCVYHNTPLLPEPNRIVDSRTAEAYVDQSGTFYPDDWEDELGSPPGRGAYALETVAKRSGQNEYVRAEEVETLKMLEGFIEDKDRIFVLVHGFNSSYSRSQEGYSAIQERVDFRPTDGVIEFFWDGLIAGGPVGIKQLGSGKIWFNATGYSQMAGTRGLRDILNLCVDKDVVLIAHSRGSSVVLSALSDPPYDTDFIIDTEKYHEGLDVYDAPPLEDNGNRIAVVLLAPALGEVDFMTPLYRCTGDRAFRDLGDQLKAVHFTVNGRDPVLRKMVAHFADRFNPTNLGYRPAVAEAVAGRLRAEGYDVGVEPIMDLPNHDFGLYVNHPTFAKMLNAVGVDMADD